MRLLIILLISTFFIFSCSESPIGENTIDLNDHVQFAGPGSGHNSNSFILKWAGSYFNNSGINDPQNALNYPDLKYINPQPNGGLSLKNFGIPDFNEYSYSEFAYFLKISEDVLRSGDYIVFEKHPPAHRWNFEDSKWMFTDGNNSFTFDFDNNNVDQPVIAVGGVGLFQSPSYSTFFSLGWGFDSHAFILVDLDPYNINYNSPNFSVTMYCGNSANMTPEIEANGVLVPKRSVIDVSLDIKPDSDTNPINLKSKGVIPVAILTTADFDASSVDPSTVTFGPADAFMAHSDAHFEDVDGDGDIDLLFHFKTQETGILSGDTQACISGKTYEGLDIQGCDNITTK